MGMKTKPEVAEKLHELMLLDLLAAEIYQIQSVLFRNWGYEKIAAHLEHESEHERLHAGKQLDRLTYLDVPIDLSQRPTGRVGSTPRECLEVGLEMEHTVAKKLNALCAACDAASDAGTRSLAEELLEDTEMDHILWLEQQLRQIDTIGEKNYLAEKI